MVVRPWGNEYDPWRETYILYDLGIIFSPSHDEFGGQCSRARPRRTEFVVKPAQKVLVTQKRVTLLIGLASHRTLIMQDALHTVFTKGVSPLLQYVGVMPVHIPSSLAALGEGWVLLLPRHPQPTWLPVT